MRSLGLSLGAILIASGSASAVFAQQDTVQLVWQSTATDQSRLSQEFADLYVSLYNSGNLKLRRVALGDRYIEPAIRDAGILYGSGFPTALDALLCDLNADVCDRERTPVDQQMLDSASNHIGGFAPSTGRWRASPTTELAIPDYTFETETFVGRMAVNASWSPGDFVATDGLDCSAWATSCAELVARFNPPLFGTKTSSTSATLPYLRYQTPIIVSVVDAEGVQSDLARRLGAAEQGDVGSPAPSPPPLVGSAPTTATAPVRSAPISSGFNAQYKGRSTPDQLIDSVRENILPIGKVKSYEAVEPGTLAPDVQAQLRAINHPFGFGKPLATMYQEPVTIGIIDHDIATRHCDWPMVRLASGGDVPLDDRDECGKAADGLLDSRDHVMLIGGIIAAKPSQHGAPGINPNAKLVFMPLELNGSADAQIQQLIQTLLSRETLSTEIINLSSGVVRNEIVGSTDMLQIAVSALQDVTLVVTAAGNEGMDLSNDCIVVPACMNDLSNVITVVGLSRDEDNPTVWQSQFAGSNTNPRFDIGAVADSVYSTVSNNRYGKDSGTSFAVPQVSAAASLVLAAAKRAWAAELEGRRISPKFVKDRLIYTADIMPSLSGRMRSGRLNVARAIDVARDQYVLFDGRVINGQTLQRPDWFECQTPDGNQKMQLFWNTRRMTYQEDSQRHFLFKHSPSASDIGDRNASLDLFESCAVKTRSPIIEVRVSPDKVETFEFGQIRDFTSRFIEEF